ncbi:hypothetical protein, partial [Vibrio diabolicus]|uniref:hypothetical protein n=1 Tax=Vibrio diabolicus TaxID=50719 RepID=UPI00211B1CA9|nr:hypothetical protein [Vibrio diabolicus]
RAAAMATQNALCTVCGDRLFRFRGRRQSDSWPDDTANFCRVDLAMVQRPGFTTDTARRSWRSDIALSGGTHAAVCARD